MLGMIILQIPSCYIYTQKHHIFLRNWFFKTARIRELMPRLYIDMALIKSYRFLEETDYDDVFSRLSKQIRVSIVYVYVFATPFTPFCTCMNLRTYPSIY